MIKESSKVEEKIKNEREVLNKAEEARLLKKHQSERITKQVELDKINNDSKLSRETKEKLLKDYEENYNNMQVAIFTVVFYIYFKLLFYFFDNHLFNS